MRCKSTRLKGSAYKVKTIRLLYPDHVSGGLDTYYFGANLLQYILPQNPNQPIIKVDVLPPITGKSL